jgi:hypothetical protein
MCHHSAVNSGRANECDSSQREQWSSTADLRSRRRGLVSAESEFALAHLEGCVRQGRGFTLKSLVPGVFAERWKCFLSSSLDGKSPSLHLRVACEVPARGLGMDASPRESSRWRCIAEALDGALSVDGEVVLDGRALAFEGANRKCPPASWAL